MGILRILLFAAAAYMVYRFVRRFVNVSFFSTTSHGTRSYRYPGEGPKEAQQKKINDEDIVDAKYKDIR